MQREAARSWPVEQRDAIGVHSGGRYKSNGMLRRAYNSRVGAAGRMRLIGMPDLGGRQAAGKCLRDGHRDAESTVLCVCECRTARLLR